MFRKLKSVKALALAGSIWTLGGYGTSQVLRLGSHLVLAWLLSPRVFGLMALVQVIQYGLNGFSDIGIKPSIIQNKRGDDPLFLNTAWTIQIIRGFALWICTCILAWPMAALYGRNDPDAWLLLYLLPVTGFGAVLEGFNSAALATLNRHLKLGRITLLELFSQVVHLGVMISWAIVHPTVWAMVAGGLASLAFKLIASHLIVPGARVRLGWDKECAHELFKFGKWVFMSTLFSFLAQYLDKLVLGNILKLGELGLYHIAFVFARVSLHVSSRLGDTVLFPVYSKYKSDPEKMVSIALRSREVVLWFGAAVCVCFAIAAPLFFQTFWDPRYHEAGLLSQWAALYIWTTILLLTSNRIPLALGNSMALFVANIWRCIGIVVAIGGYRLAGLPGFILGLTMGPLFAHLYILRHIPLERGSILLQGTWFSLVALVYAIPSIVVTRWSSNHLGIWSVGAIVVLLAGIPLAVSSLVVWKRVRSEFAK